jgi:hypothetical protein
MSRQAAKIILDVAIRHMEEGYRTLKGVEKQCTSEEFEELKLGMAECHGTMVQDLINPILRRYPELKPPEA